MFSLPPASIRYPSQWCGRSSLLECSVVGQIKLGIECEKHVFRVCINICFDMLDSEMKEMDLDKEKNDDSFRVYIFLCPTYAKLRQTFCKTIA